jgi:hypothetical protein
MGGSMAILVWIGAAITLIGFGGIVWTIFAVRSARNAGLPDDALRAKLGRILPVNLAALAVSMLGLMFVVVGVILG